MHPIVYVEWIDSTSWTGWMATRDRVKRSIDKCISIGFLIDEDEQRILIVQSVALENEAEDVVERSSEMLGIPKVSILARRILEDAK